MNTVLLRGVVVGLLMLLALYGGYALAAGYVGGLPSPLNLVAGLTVLATAAVASARVLRGTHAADLPL